MQTATAMDVRRQYSVNGDWDEELKRIKENDPDVTVFDEDWIQDLTDDGLEQLGKDIANNTHLDYVNLSHDAINDHKMSFLFRGLNRSSSIKHLNLNNNQLSVAAIRGMVPFLQNANNLTKLDLDENNLQSEGFNVMFKALSDSPIEQLRCAYCDIKSIEIDTKQIPRQLKKLFLQGNIINADGCRGLAKLLEGGDATALTDLYLSNNQVDYDGVEILAKALRKNKSLTDLDLKNNKIGSDGVAALATALKSNTTLETLHLCNNKIGDDGVAALVVALRRNTTLRELYLRGNTGMSKIGKISLLKLVIDISSIEATLQSNHTLTELKFTDYNDRSDIIQHLIDTAVEITSYSPGVVGREKVRRLLLNDTKRAQLADIQGVTHSVYSEIDSLYLPEVLALINRYSYSYPSGKELFPALKSTMTGLLSRVDMKLCIQEQMARHEARIEKQAALYEARISEHRDQIAHHEEQIKATISERESMMDEHGVKMEELKARLAAMEDPGQEKNQDTRTQSNKRRRVD
jgi:Ran GTPase-activating protein (RanGAP) involved in mRNA processing and transport